MTHALHLAGIGRGVWLLCNEDFYDEEDRHWFNPQQQQFFEWYDAYLTGLQHLNDVSVLVADSNTVLNDFLEKRGSLESFTVDPIADTGVRQYGIASVAWHSLEWRYAGRPAQLSYNRVSYLAHQLRDGVIFYQHPALTMPVVMIMLANGKYLWLAMCDDRPTSLELGLFAQEILDSLPAASRSWDEVTIPHFGINTSSAALWLIGLRVGGIEEVAQISQVVQELYIATPPVSLGLPPLDTSVIFDRPFMAWITAQDSWIVDTVFYVEPDCWIKALGT